MQLGVCYYSKRNQWHMRHSLILREHYIQHATTFMACHFVQNIKCFKGSRPVIGHRVVISWSSVGYVNRLYSLQFIVCINSINACGVAYCIILNTNHIVHT